MVIHQRFYGSGEHCGKKKTIKLNNSRNYYKYHNNI